ncbi:elongation factor G [Vulcanimicrobium alpinum]|uniref:Elongation factor G n=1 Tax=Vulcanimicrobium alpinum TaxID=3016050 RepID=A0AAN1XYJ4_UNVUL|nr:elongation factor G [Vulcanimicrobium alpinum]BDE07285.1 elongation factor G [Vulcanimicrobium alpinum]
MQDISRLRNVAIVGPHHAGKTTLVEALLAHCGAIPRRGSVRDGTTTTDCEPEAIDHLQSVCVGFAHANCVDVDLNLVDTPGFVDFFEETKTVLSAVDAAVVVIDAEPGRVAQTAALVEYLEMRAMPHLFFVNKLDRPGAQFDATLAALRSAYGAHVVATHLPIGSGETFSGYVDLACSKAFGSNGTVEEIPIPTALEGAAAAQRTTLLEALADFDDTLLEELLEGQTPTQDEIDRDLCEDCSHDQIVPVLVGSAEKGFGVWPLVDAIARLFPSPATEPRRDVDGRPVVPRDDGAVVAQVCKTIMHPQQGKLSVVRVFTGTLTPSSTIVDASRGNAPVRLSGMARLFGKKQEPVTSAGPGAIVALARLEGVGTGDTLASPNAGVLMPTVPLAEPSFAVAIAPKQRLDEAKLSQALARLLDEDPALRVARAEFTNELQLLGNGETHVTTATERLARKYNVDVTTHPPSIAYRETIQSPTEIHSRYKHQTGGHGQFADVHLRFEPRARGSGVTFAETIVGGVVPRQFFPAVEKGVREALASGGPHGFPVTDLHVTLFDGAFHDVDSSEASFKTASGMAVREALQKLGTVVLEPLMRVETTVPSTTMSAAVSQLTAKRGQILGFEPAEKTGWDRIIALVPQAELGRYATELRTATAGLGTYAARHERFEIAPERAVEAPA